MTSRSLLVLGLAALGSIFLGKRLPLPPDDPFRGTLAILPLLIVGFALISRWTRARFPRQAPGAAGFGEGALLVLLVLLVLGRSSFGLGGSAAVVDRLLAGAFVLLLAHRLLWTLVELRPALGERLRPRPPLVFLALPLLVYLAILPWSTQQHPPDGDEPYYLLITHSLAYDLDADLANNYQQGDSLRFMPRRIGPQPGDPVGEHGEKYSRHNLFVPLLLVGSIHGRARLADPPTGLFLRS
jgi:hypothetical protein